MILALVMAGTALVTSGGAFSRAVLEQRASQLSLSRLQAFHLSEGAIDMALHTFQTDPSYAGTTDTPAGVPGSGYSIAVLQDGPSRRIIRATGYASAGHAAGSDRVATTIEVVVQLTRRAGPGYGVLGVQSVRFDGWGRGGLRDRGLLADSYDAREGSYTSSGSRANLRVCTNGSEDQAVSLIGAVAIRGDVVLGPGSDPRRTLRRYPESLTSISGSVRVANGGVPVEEIDMPLLPDGGRLSISGQEVVSLPGGLYRFQEIQIAGHGRLVFTGPAEVYVEDRVRISGHGAIDTAARLPSNLTLYVKGADVSVGGEGDLYARLVAPHATVEFSGDGDLYGAVTGREVIVNGRGSLHYDEALNLYDEALNPSSGDDPPFHASLLSWRQVN